MPRLTDDDKQWLGVNHPNLVVTELAHMSLVEGQFKFSASYKGYELSDSYAIRLELNAKSEAPPRLFETGGRLKTVLDRHKEFKGNWAEMHVYPDERLCLAAPQELRLVYLQDPSAKLLAQDYMKPYFYSQSFFETEGTWPWPQLPHNTTGILTWYLDNHEIPGAAQETILSLIWLADKYYPKAKRTIAKLSKYDSFSPYIKCLCGSGKRQGACHPQYIKLALEVRATKYKIRSI